METSFHGETSTVLKEIITPSLRHTQASSLQSFGLLLVKEPACKYGRHETRVPSLSQEDPLEKGMATLSSILAWRIPGTEEPDGL